MGNDADCWIGLRKYSLKYSDQSWYWIDGTTPLSEENGDFLAYGSALKLIWRLMPPYDRCGTMTPSGWGNLPCRYLNNKRSCFVCASALVDWTPEEGNPTLPSTVTPSDDPLWTDENESASSSSSSSTTTTTMPFSLNITSTTTTTTTTTSTTTVPSVNLSTTTSTTTQISSVTPGQDGGESTTSTTSLGTLLTSSSTETPSSTEEDAEVAESSTSSTTKPETNSSSSTTTSTTSSTTSSTTTTSTTTLWDSNVVLATTSTTTPVLSSSTSTTSLTGCDLLDSTTATDVAGLSLECSQQTNPHQEESPGGLESGDTPSSNGGGGSDEDDPTQGAARETAETASNSQASGGSSTKTLVIIIVPIVIVILVACLIFLLCLRKRRRKRQEEQEINIFASGLTPASRQNKRLEGGAGCCGGKEGKSPETARQRRHRSGSFSDDLNMGAGAELFFSALATAARVEDRQTLHTELDVEDEWRPTDPSAWTMRDRPLTIVPEGSQEASTTLSNTMDSRSVAGMSIVSSQRGWDTSDVGERAR